MRSTAGRRSSRTRRMSSCRRGSSDAPTMFFRSFPETQDTACALGRRPADRRPMARRHPSAGCEFRYDAMMRAAVRAAALAAMLVASVRPSAQSESLQSVLARAGQYVSDYYRQLTGLVGEEDYVQDARQLS